MSIKNISDKSRKKLENKILEGGTADNDHRVTVPKNTSANLAALDRHEGSIAYDQTLSKIVYDDGTGFAAITPTDITLDDVTLTGTLTTSDDIVSTVEDYNETGSFQNFAGDLNVNDAGGSDDGTDTSFLAPVMGNILGADVAGEGNYLAGVIGAMSITAPVSEYPIAAVQGIIMDGSTGADGCFVAVIDGSDPSAETRARAAYAVKMNNNHADSGVDYGLDLKASANDNYSGTGRAFAVDNAEIRTSLDVCLMNASGAPVNGTTGDNFAGPGSLYIRTDSPSLFMNTGAINNPTWTQVGAAGANTALSNLAATAVNAHILPASDGDFDLGATGFPWDEIWGYNIKSPFSMNIRAINGAVNINTIDGDSGNTINIETCEVTGATNGAPVNMGSGTSQTGTTGGVTIYSGNSSGGNSGDIEIRTGTAATTRGHITLSALFANLPTGVADPAGASDGAVYYNSDTDELRLRANGAWVSIVVI